MCLLITFANFRLPIGKNNRIIKPSMPHEIKFRPIKRRPTNPEYPFAFAKSQLQDKKAIRNAKPKIPIVVSRVEDGIAIIDDAQVV